jgi:hypothetical protein
MSVYHVHQTQRVPADPNWRVNCTAYAASMCIDDFTHGAAHMTGARVRALSDEPVPDPHSPGLNIPQVCAVAHKVGVPLRDMSGRSWADLRILVIGARRALVDIDYASLGAYRCQANGDFGHAICIAWWGRTTVAVSDPLCLQTRVYPESVIRHAAEVFARQTSMFNGIRFAVTNKIARNLT